MEQWVTRHNAIANAMLIFAGEFSGNNRMTPLIIDNGSYTIKFGHANSKVPIYQATNALIRTKDKKLHLSNQYNTLTDFSGLSFKRPHEKGHLVSWELERQIWEYCLYNPTDFPKLNITDTTGMDLIVTEMPFTIPELSKNLDQVVFEEFEFGSLYRSCPAGFVPFNVKNNDKLAWPEIEHTVTKSSYNDFQLVIDSGFNCTWVIPIIKGVIYWRGVKRLDIGGRFLSGFLREMISFRHFNVTEETVLVNRIKEAACFVSPDYSQSLKQIGSQKHLMEYVLPDFTTSYTGYFLTPEMKKKMIKDDVYGQQQIIKLNDERFSVPETFFHPEIANIIKPGIIETIVESIFQLPEVLRPLLVANIVLIGGNFNLPNFRERLHKELKAQLPVEWDIRISLDKQPELYGFKSACEFAKTDHYKEVRVTREEYHEHGAEWLRKRFGYSY